MRTFLPAAFKIALRNKAPGVQKQKNLCGDVATYASVSCHEHQ
jgi:hypothetical protein